MTNPPNVLACREAFEKWAGSPPVEFSVGLSEADESAHWCWVAWQVAWQAAMQAPIVTDAVMRQCIIDYAVLVGELSKGLHIDDPIWQSIRDCGKSYFDLLIEPKAALAAPESP